MLENTAEDDGAGGRVRTEGGSGDDRCGVRKYQQVLLLTQDGLTSFLYKLDNETCMFCTLKARESEALPVLCSAPSELVFLYRVL